MTFHLPLNPQTQPQVTECTLWTKEATCIQTFPIKTMIPQEPNNFHILCSPPNLLSVFSWDIGKILVILLSRNSYIYKYTFSHLADILSKTSLAEQMRVLLKDTTVAFWFKELSLSMKQAIIRLNKNIKKPIREIATPLGVAKSTIWCILRQKKRKKRKKEHARELRNTKRTEKILLLKISVSKSSINRRLSPE